MSIFITGATGFLGKNLIKNFKTAGYSCGQIIVAAGKRQEWLEQEGFRVFLHKNYTYTKQELCALLHPGEEIDTVIHIGALTPKGNKNDALLDFKENIRTTKHIAENLPNVPDCFLFGSSVSVYNDNEESVDGQYGKYKRDCEEFLIEHLSGSALWILRFGPIYGPGEETYQKIAGTFIREAMLRHEIRIKGDGSSRRNMVFVDDVSKKILQILELADMQKKGVRIIDIVNDKDISVLELAELAIQITSSSSKIVFEDGGGETPAARGLPDGNTMRRELGTLPTSYEEGMRMLYDHFVANGI